VVSYAIAGTMKLDLTHDPLGQDPDGNPVYLKDIWPTSAEIQAVIDKSLTPEMFASRYGNVFEGPEQWRAIRTTTGQTYEWDMGSTYIQAPPFFDQMAAEPEAPGDIHGARPLAILANSVTTDHISPAGSIKQDSPAGHYLLGYQVRPAEFNSYGSRRGNHEVMMRGTFANIRIRNEMVPGVEGGFTAHQPDGEKMPIYDAAMKYQEEGVPLVVIAGKEYGTGSSRDWAAKGTRLLGVKAVIVESFERIHRSNLIGMGVLPLQFPDGVDRKTLGLTGVESFDVLGIADGLAPRCRIDLVIHRPNGGEETVGLLCRIDTADELEYYRHGGILHYVLRNLLAA